MMMMVIFAVDEDDDNDGDDFGTVQVIESWNWRCVSTFDPYSILSHSASWQEKICLDNK